MGSDRVPRASPAPFGVNVVCSPNKSSKEGSGGGRVGGGSGREGQVLLLHLLRGFPLGGVSCYLLSLTPGHGGNGGGCCSQTITMESQLFLPFFAARVSLHPTQGLWETGSLFPSEARPRRMSGDSGKGSS